ncbi:MAG TPA: hypothetical protein VE442_04705 [Jatrophihabitans sp.]|nr:hypothetical protein [Jatrophihabitans sp.]
MGRPKYPADLWDEFYAAQRRSWSFIVPMIVALALGGITKPTFKHFSSDWPILAVLAVVVAVAWIFCVRYVRALIAVARRARAYRRANPTT